MSKHWTDNLLNVVSPELQSVWLQMAEAFNAQIDDAINAHADNWRVLQPTTGTGKSQGVAVYSAMLPAEDHPGVLIVTRLKSQADEVTDSVNKIAGRGIARSFHGDNSEGSDALDTFPVLVITHRAYEIGLDAKTTDKRRRTGLSTTLGVTTRAS